MSSESTFSNFFKNDFSAKNFAFGAVLIACPIIGIPYGASLLLKKCNNENTENSNNNKNQNYYEYDEREKLKKD